MRHQAKSLDQAFEILFESLSKTLSNSQRRPDLDHEDDSEGDALADFQSGAGSPARTCSGWWTDPITTDADFYQAGHTGTQRPSLQAISCTAGER